MSQKSDYSVLVAQLINLPIILPNSLLGRAVGRFLIFSTLVSDKMTLTASSIMAGTMYSVSPQQYPVLEVNRRSTAL